MVKNSTLSHLDQEQGREVPSLVFSILPEVLANAIRQEQEIKCMQIKEDTELSWFTENMIDHLRTKSKRIDQKTPKTHK